MERLLERLLRAALWLLLLLAVGTGTLRAIRGASPAPPAIPFAERRDPSLADPDNPARVFRVDLARVERDHPLTRAVRGGITEADVRALSQEEVDQLYARLTAGPIPDGFYRGVLFFPRGDSLRPRLAEILGGAQGRIAAGRLELAEAAARALWKGKIFHRDRREQVNAVVATGALWRLVDDPATLETATVPRDGWLGHVAPITEARLLFPAKVYCGQSLLDGRRESIIIDYGYSDALPGYRERPDALVGRAGLNIRDELRMIRPGLYLGRAYASRIFLLDFTLYNPEVAEAGAAAFAAGGPVAEDCWPGEQARE